VTGTGRTVTLQGIIGGFSECGVSYLVADAMDNPSGLGIAGSPPPKPPKSSPPRAAEIGDTDWSYSDNPVQFRDLPGERAARSAPPSAKWGR
jgi:hypothetical protein